MRKIIAFAGSKQSGKSTALKTLCAVHADIKEIMFARKLKEVCSEVFDIDLSTFENGVAKEIQFEDPIFLTNIHLESVIANFGQIFDYDLHVRPFVGSMLYTPREVLQFIGTEVLHNVDPDIHIKTALKDFPKDGLIVITDMRFEQEFNFLQQNFKDEFHPYYINNNKAELIAQCDNHKSEKDLHKFKHKCTFVDNNTSLLEFEEKLKNALRSIL